MTVRDAIRAGTPLAACTWPAGLVTAVSMLLVVGLGALLCAAALLTR